MTTNATRARAFFARLGGEEPADVLEAALMAMLDEAGGVRLAGDPFIEGVAAEAVRTQLRGIQGRGGVMAFPAVAVAVAADRITKAVLRAIDEYRETAEQPTDPLRPAPTTKETP